MKAGLGLGAFTLVALLTGCVAGGAREDTRVWCNGGAGNEGRPVLVQVTIDADSKGARVRGVEPAECRVRPGTVVRFVSVGPGQDRFSKIVFRGQTASADGLQQLPAEGGRGSPRSVVMVARWVDEATPFPYVVSIDGDEFDPDIIIDPARNRK